MGSKKEQEDVSLHAVGLTLGTEACSTQCDFTILEVFDNPFQNVQETIVGVFYY